MSTVLRSGVTQVIHSCAARSVRARAGALAARSCADHNRLDARCSTLEGTRYETRMTTCAFLNAFAERSRGPALERRHDAGRVPAVRQVPAYLARITGWRATLNLLRSIPASNDDFSL